MQTSFFGADKHGAAFADEVLDEGVVAVKIVAAEVEADVEGGHAIGAEETHADVVGLGGKDEEE